MALERKSFTEEADRLRARAEQDGLSVEDEVGKLLQERGVRSKTARS